MPDQSSTSTEVEVTRPRYGGLFDLPDGGSLPYVLPGEIIDLAPRAEASQPLRINFVSILKAAPERVVPSCVHFGACGGCHYQHAHYPAQVELKRQILGDLLAAAGQAKLPDIRCHEAEPWGYRNRIRLRVEPDLEYSVRSFRIGYSRQGSNEFLPIRMCPISAPLLFRAAETVLLLADTDPICHLWLRVTSELELFCAPAESRLQLTFFLRHVEFTHRDPGSFAGFCERLRTKLPELGCAGAELHPELNRRERRSWAGTSWGAAGLAYPAAGRSYWISRGAFFQVNRFLVDRLVALVTEGQQGRLAWDLFAGVGLFARALADTYENVVAVEGGESAAADLTGASRGGKGQPSFEARRSSTLHFLRALQLQRERPDLIVLDPPRAGLGAEGSAILAQFAASSAPAPRVVYVSCDPVTLVRDLAILTRTAYRIDALDMVDLFPQTYHMETVVHLSRA